MTQTPSAPSVSDRVAHVQRNTSETQIGVRVNLDGTPIVTMPAAPKTYSNGYAANPTAINLPSAWDSMPSAAALPAMGAHAQSNAELLQLLRAESLNRNGYVLQIFAALLRGHDDFAAVL